MSARNFATTNAGRNIKINVRAASPGRANWPIGRVIGYIVHPDDFQIVLEMRDVADRHLSQPIENIRGFVRTYVNEFHPEMGWIVNKDNVRFLRKKQAAPKPISPYPHSCLKCNSPARNCGEFILCSNVKCKTRGKVRRFFSATNPRKDNWISCPTCGGFGIRGSGDFDRAGNQIFNASCLKGHNWTTKLKSGLLLRTSLAGTTSDRMWDGDKWVHY